MRRKLAQRGDRSRSPHIKSAPAVTFLQNTPLALDDRANPKSKGKGKGQKNANKKGKAKAAPHSTASSSRMPRGFKTFSQIRTNPAVRSGFVAQDKVQEPVVGSRATSHASSHRVTGHTSASGVASRMFRTFLAVA